MFETFFVVAFIYLADAVFRRVDVMTVVTDVCRKRGR